MAKDKQLDNIFKRYAKLSKTELTLALTEEASLVIPSLNEIMGEGKGAEFFLHLILDIMSVDRKIDKDEYAVCEPFLVAAFGDSVSYEKVKDSMSDRSKKDVKEITDSIDAFVDKIGSLSTDLKIHIVGICMIVCAADGNISKAEKEMLYKLLEN